MAKLTVRARAVDMLGRQQINGIPTAIHELFKNAHDAYAERVEVDYFRRTKVMILRDDGYGMTEEEVKNRWLTLGTESRVGANSQQEKFPWTGPKKLSPRAIMGEKGIGRLAIAVIAPITLLMTRATKPDGLHDLVVALVHWGLFEQPGLDVNQIDVPVKTFPGGTLPTDVDIHNLVNDIRANLNELQSEISPSAWEALNEQLNHVHLNPEKLDAHLRTFHNPSKLDEPDFPPMSLKDNGYGTHFIMLPTHPEIENDIDGTKDSKESDLRKNLLGFSNYMADDKPVIFTRFRDHNSGEKPDELVDGKEFFSNHDFKNTDQYVVGEFDEYGQFVGTVKIYEESPKKFVCNWPDGRGRQTRCGPFKIRFGYIQGLPKETILPKDIWLEQSEKVDRIGGLYIYRNGIRILPYGNSDIDFLEIEKRRTLSAQDWFFSYRRIFGYIDIDHLNNQGLTEKAGREGFRQNLAYREFRDILINLFKRLAMEFFRPTSPQADAFWDKKNELNAQDAYLKKQDKKSDSRRKAFSGELSGVIDLYSENYFENQADKIRQQTLEQLEIINYLEDDGDLAIAVRELEYSVHFKIRELVKKLSITKPRGLSLKKKQEQEWSTYQRIALRVRDEVLNPLRRELTQLINDSTSQRITDAQRRETALVSAEKQRDLLIRELSELRNTTYKAGEAMQLTLRSVVKEEFAELTAGVESKLSQLVRESAQNPAQLDAARAEFEASLDEVREKEGALLDAIKRQMEVINEELLERLTYEDRAGALEQKVQRLEEQLDFYADFAQMGMSVGILQHEFEKSAHDMRLAMRDLQPWAKGTPALNNIYSRLRLSFDHLDGYLSLLDPLGRRMNRRKVEISGDEIRLHLLRVFGKVLDENKIVLRATNEFIGTTVLCHSSALLGAFINLLDNAIYWVSVGARDVKEIILDKDLEGFTVTNTGPGINVRDILVIFEFGESRKPGGRGMGLAISKDILQREGFDLELLTDGEETNPVFRIKINMEEGVDTEDEQSYYTA
ncbi:ATP-binding protein [Shewanella chilikensis]|uniref:ATP-binding protein n=1 Tax=Shewanella chilikensis TaxID=558541 RepID=UPI00399B915A